MERVRMQSRDLSQRLQGFLKNSRVLDRSDRAAAHGAGLIPRKPTALPCV